jgi:Predicted membrane protein (DUF2339)
VSRSIQTELDEFGKRLRVLEVELELLRVDAARATSAPETSGVERPISAARPQRAAPPPSYLRVGQEDVEPSTPIRLPRPPRRSRTRRLPELRVSDLLGARALALAGGSVTLLGIVFFFVLAVNRGWIGPPGRVMLGSAASAAVFLAGVALQRRFGTTYSALASVGAGIAGAYATLLAAAALYGMLPDVAALGAAAGIAAVGVAVALRWRAEIIAGLGLIGAILVPVAVAAQGSLGVVGTAFALIMLAASAAVAVRERWTRLLAAGMVAAAPQIVALVFEPEYRGNATAGVVGLVAVYVLLHLSIGIAWELRARVGAPMARMTTMSIAGAALLGAVSAARLSETPAGRGTGLLAMALLYAVVASILFSHRASRDLGAFLAGIAFIAGAVGLSDLLSGQSLTYAWAAEAAALSWVARRVREVRFQFWSAAYLALAVGHVLVVTPPIVLFAPGHDPARGVAPAIAAALAAVVFAVYARPWNEPPLGANTRFTRALVRFAAADRLVRTLAISVGAVMATYGISLGLLSLFASFDWCHVVLAAIWAVIGVGILTSGLKRRSTPLRDGGIAWIGATTVVVVAHSATMLATTPRAAAFLVVAAALLGSAFLYQLLEPHDGLEPLTAGATLVSLGLTWDALAMLLHGRTGAIDREGAALLAVAIFYGVLAVLVFRLQRDFSTLLWSAALVVGGAAAKELVGGPWLVLAWALGGAGLAWLSSRAREPRLLLAAVVYGLAALVHTVVFEAPPVDLFTLQARPAAGVPSVAVVALAVGIGALYMQGATSYASRGRATAWWTSGVLAVYGVSLSILELTQQVFPHGSLRTDFQRGHTGVSAFWGLLGLGLLYLGLKRWRFFRVAGFALFGVSLVKIFLYDLPSLSSLTRAVSFLAVGAVLLLGGFFYQRLTASEDERGELVPRPGT